MAARVQIIVETKDISSGILRGITSQFGQLGSVIEEMTSKNVNWGNVAQQATQLVVQAVVDAVKATQEYAAQVRDLSLASGASAEEASRLLQVLDDFEISAADVTAATKALTKNGLEPSMETIAQLADKYVKLNSAQEKNQFIIDNLGRGGLKWAMALSQGGDALRALNDDVNASLILNEQAIANSERYRLAIDNWNDSVQGAKISLGNELLPVLTNVLDVTSAGAEATKGQISAWEYALGPVAGIHAGYLLLTDGVSNYKTIQEAAIPPTQGLSIAEQDLALAVTMAGQAAEASSVNYSSLLGMMEKLNGATQEQIKLSAYQDLKQKLSEGGIDDAEAATLEEAGIALGVFDANAAASAKSIDALNSKLAAGKVTVQEYIKLLNEIPTQIETTVVINQEGTIPEGPLGQGQASGGAVYAGNPYMVGENGPEPFIPAQNGRVLGHAESLHAMTLTGGGGGTNYFYGNVTLSVDGNTADGLLGYR